MQFPAAIGCWLVCWFLLLVGGLVVECFVLFFLFFRLTFIGLPWVLVVNPTLALEGFNFSFQMSGF